MKSLSLIKRIAVPIGLVSFLGVGSLLSPQPASAIIINGSFESSPTVLTGWNLNGVVSMQTASFGVTPTNGFNQALATTGNGSLSTNNTGGLEDFLGVPLGIFDNPSDPFYGAAAQGSAIYQSFAAQAGDTVTLDWNFLTNDTAQPDYAFLFLAKDSDLGTLTYNDLIKLNSSAGLISLTSVFCQPTSPCEQTGYRPYSASITSSGTYVLGVGVVDVLDTDGDSGVLLDNVKLNQSGTNVPEGSTLGGLGLMGLVGLTQCYLRHRQTRTPIH